MPGNIIKKSKSIAFPNQNHSTIDGTDMPNSNISSISRIISTSNTVEQSPNYNMMAISNNDHLSVKRNEKIPRSHKRQINQSFWQTTMNTSFHVFIIIVISCMTEFVSALNGSSRNGGVAGGVQRSNSIPQDGPYKNAQSAASVSNIVNGHYQPLEEDEEAPPISILADSRHFASTIDDNDEGYWREVKAIIGGVLGFWGGIGSLGTLFLVVVMSKRYCCRDVDDKEDAKDG